MVKVFSNFHSKEEQEVCHYQNKKLYRVNLDKKLVKINNSFLSMQKVSKMTINLNHLKEMAMIIITRILEEQSQ